jgi:peptidoglycan/xylan/chitin deacetylase (PgdA/CDA1 family)
VTKKLHLHLDADTSSRALYNALLERGHDVTCTPTDWMPLDASDEQQLLGATAQGRAIFTYNIRDFIFLGIRYPNHAGIILSYQKSMSLIEMINALDRILRETRAQEWIGQRRWLNDWR